MSVVLGEYDRSADATATSQRPAVRDVLIHPHFDGAMGNDQALIILQVR